MGRSRARAERLRAAHAGGRRHDRGLDHATAVSDLMEGQSCAAVLQIGGDPGGAEGVVADRRGDARLARRRLTSHGASALQVDPRDIGDVLLEDDMVHVVFQPDEDSYSLSPRLHSAVAACFPR